MGLTLFGTLEQFFFPDVQEKKRQLMEDALIPDTMYFKHSHVAYIHNQLMTETIFRPYRRLIVYDHFLKLKQDLWDMLMISCEKGQESQKEYWQHIDIEKVAIQVDYLIIVKEQGVPIAFTSGTYINKKLFYINCSMTIPTYQHSGIGSVLTAMLCNQVVLDNFRMGEIAPFFIARTQNRRAARSLLRAMYQGKISTEPGLTRMDQLRLAQTSRFLKCKIDTETGISSDVYPRGLPKGTGIKDQRIQKAFSRLAPRDGCYVIGRINERLIRYLITKHVGSPFENTLHQKRAVK